MKLVFDPSRVLTLDIDKVRPNTYNPKEKDTTEYQKIKKGLESEGQRLPVIVRENDGYEIIDGEQRYTAMKELGAEQIIVYNEGVVSDEKAKALTIWYEQQVPFEEVGLAKLVKELYELEVVLPYSDAEVKDFLELAEFDFGQYNTERPEDDEDGIKTVLIKVSDSQYEIIMNALQQVQEQNDCGEARALELICADYLSGH